MPLSGTRVLVVGGARNIGRAIAEHAARAGATPIIASRSLERAGAAAAEVPGAEAVEIDVTDEASIVAGLDGAGEIDHVVVLSVAHHNVPVEELDHDLTMAAFEARIVGPLMLAKHAASRLRPGGSLVLFSGVAGWIPFPGSVNMGVTSGAAAFMATHLAKELAPVRVNAIAPGVIDSGVWEDHLDADAKRDFLDSCAAGTLVGRVGTNEDIAEAVLWLLGATFVTGETIHVDGGARH
ncbi:SDR family oxidoreductase [Demequina mangrovi]|uniref:NAD(P)-dependent dehydrogenase, short-chain alcohol dehydrogenase family n=1 Tax=Demequina mangrovi TaxID=1043493 RepID=A0A1H6WJH8_9MICO|nr:SDR family oxidoreductase [Demequina mangrovi]SEJ12505.1 NAD(P)-dependent dehydrogenase, short-chain alcohol dehydrogenase family [Demequina mangrovi]